MTSHDRGGPPVVFSCATAMLADGTVVRGRRYVSVERELQRCYVERQRLFQRWAAENERDPLEAVARRLERRAELRRLERRIRELEALRRLERADLAARIDAIGLAERLRRLVGEEGGDG